MFEAAAAVRLHSVINSKRLMALGGLASILFGILTIARPDATLVSLAVLFGVFAVLFGTCQTVVGFRLRELAEAMQPLARSEPRQRMLRKASRQWRVR